MRRLRMRWRASASLLFHCFASFAGLRERLKAILMKSPIRRARTIVFETRAYISYNLKFVY
jgi:hypothetical protein